MPPERRSPSVRVLDVLLNDGPVGTLTHLPGESTLFAFSDDYLQDLNRPTLSLSFKIADGGVASATRPTHLKVPPFFSNLLPEGHLRDYLADRGGVSPHREFFLLWLLGQDLPGAVVVRPAEGEALPPEAVEDGHHEAHDGEVLRFSLAGIQLKFSALLESDGGLTIPARGVGGSWIVKLPSARHASVPENEYVMMELAREAGIRVPDTKLVPMGDIAGLPADVELAGLTLAVRRFDRDAEGRRIHMEDFAQVFDVFPADKYETASYENLAGVLWAEAAQSDVAEFSRRLAFSALIGNGDMHLKNWSLIYRDGRSAELAPAYDFVSTVPYIPQDRMALSLGGTKDWADVSLDLFRRFAARAGLPESLVVEAARETAGRFVSAWEHHEVVGRLPDAVRSRIAEHIRTVPLSRSA